MKKNINKLVSLVLIFVLCISSIPLNASAVTTYKATESVCYDSNGKGIVAANQVGGLPAGLREGYFKIDGKRAYCIELNSPFSTTDNYIVNTNSASSTWRNFGDNKKVLINAIMCFGLEGSNREGIGYKTVGGRSVYFVKMYGYTVSLYEAYLATQLLIWEVTEGYRSVYKPYTSTKYNLYKAYSGTAGTNIKNIYNAIVKELSDFNAYPSFTTIRKYTAPTYRFNVSYNPSDGYKIRSSAKTLTDKKNVLSNYPALASNRSIAFKGYRNAVKYLNIAASSSGNKLTLKPVSITDTAKYSTGEVLSKEESIPTTDIARLIAYGDSDKKDIQDIVCGGAVDPVYAHYKLSVDYEYEKSSRNFRIEKSARDSSGNDLDEAKSGWYFYVKLPTVNSTEASYKYYDSSTDTVKVGQVGSQNFAGYFGSAKMKLCKNNYAGANKAQGEYYMIFGPTTRAEGQTGTILLYIRRYIDAACGTVDGTEVPYGNYYIYELGKKTSDFSATKTINGDESNIDMNPNHYSIPVGYSSYYYTYKEHCAGDYRESIDGAEGSASTIEVNHYKHLKRILCSFTQDEIRSTTFVNYCKTKLRIAKTSEDGFIENVYFKLSYLDDENNVTKSQQVGPTDSKGHIDIWLNSGKYKIEELGYGIPPVIAPYSKLPKPIAITLNDKTFSEYYENGYYQIDFINSANAQIRVFKQDKDTQKYLNGAVYGIYNTKNKLLETLPATDTVQQGSLTYEGFSQSVNNYAFGDYYIKEISAPDGYLVDKNIYPIKIDNANLDREEYNGIKVLRNRITINVADEKTQCFISKKAITGDDELLGAVLRLADKDGNLIDEWTSGSEPHKIEGLVFGEGYILTEITPPNGYSTTSSIEFTYTENQQTVIMRDDTTKVEILKVDEKGNPLKNAILQLYDENDNLIDEWTTDGTAHQIYGELTVEKTYRLHEKSAPNSNYKLADDITFTVSDTSEVQTVTMVNKLYYGSVTIQKQGGNGNNLSGAEFKLYKADGTYITVTKNSDGNYAVNENGNTTLSVDSNGSLKVSNIELGDYYFIETKAPDGKMPYADKISFTISSENEKTLNPELIVRDDSLVMLSTGGSGYVLPFVIGIIAIVLSITCGIYIKKIRRKKQ